ELGLWFVLSIPALTAGFVLSGFFKGLGVPAIGVGLESGLPALLASLAVLLLQQVFSYENEIVIGVAYCVSAWSVIGVGLAYLVIDSSRTHWKFSVADILEQLNGFYARVKSFHLILIGNFFHANAYVLIVSIQLGADDAGMLRVVERLAMLISFPLTVVNAICARFFALSYNDGDYYELKREYRKSALTSFSLGLPVFLVVVGFSGTILRGFEIDPIRGGALLLLLAMGHMVNILTGSIAVLLNMTGYEKLVRNVTLLNSLVSLPTLWVMATIGAYNVAFALTVFLVAQNALLVFYGFKYIIGNRGLR
ncbi:MAG: hypothetical protein RJQ10_17010, partial [Haliea sp.]|uniref:lipopolysaccharide biosynthesis protein n=1 Tax=Haliea sp. TaxID=1932666 RepID=UPI0032EBAE46